MNNKIQALIVKYENKVRDMQSRNKIIPNDVVEGIILAYENVIRDLKKLLTSP